MTLLDLWAGVRPKTLVASVSPIAVASAYTWSQGYDWQSGLVFCALMSAICIQIATNFINDAVDFKKGTDTQERLGPKRLTQSGAASYAVVMRWGFVFLALAVFFGVPLVWVGGWPLLGIGLISMAMAYAYTAGPFPLAYRGWGEGFVILFFGIIAVMGMIYVLTRRWLPGGFYWGLWVGLQAASLILINNIRDQEGDRRSGRRTLPIRWGLQSSRVLLAFFLVSPSLGAAAFLGYFKQYYLMILPLLVLPSAFKLVYQVFKTAPSPAYNGFLAQAGLIQVRWTFFVVLALILAFKSSAFMAL